MLKKVLGALWRRLPKSARRLSVRVTQESFTATAGAVIIDADNRVLLLKHVFRAGSGWGIPGGFIRKGEQPEEALRRELREEIALEVEDIELAFVRTLPTINQIEVFFRCRAQGSVTPRSMEIKGATWFRLNELPEGLSRDQRRLIKRLLGDEHLKP